MVSTQGNVAAPFEQTALPPSENSGIVLLYDTLTGVPSRGAYDAMGLPSCRKNNLPNLFQVEQHMAHRHRVEWATIQRLEEREAAEAQRSYQRTIQETLMAGMGKNLHHETCPDSGEDFTATVKIAALNKRDGHRKQEHGWQGKFASV